jgi:hypothetical protein
MLEIALAELDKARRVCEKAETTQAFMNMRKWEEEVIRLRHV